MRLFWAVPIASESAREIASLTSRKLAPSLPFRWMSAGEFHVTVVFLGETPGERVADIQGAVAGALSKTRPFEIELGRVGGFPNVDRASVLWIGVAAGAEQLTAAYEKTAAALEPQGYSRESRGYTPHLTVGRRRIARKLTAAAQQAVVRASAWRSSPLLVDRLTLYSSELGRDGPQYTPVAEARLGGEAKL